MYSHHYLHIDSVFSGAVNGAVETEADDEDLPIDHKAESVTRPAVTPTTLSLAKPIHYLLFACFQSKDSVINGYPIYRIGKLMIY